MVEIEKIKTKMNNNLKLINTETKEYKKAKDNYHI